MLTLVSMIYITTFAGGLIAAGLNVYVTDRLGFGLVSGSEELSDARSRLSAQSVSLWVM